MPKQVERTHVKKYANNKLSYALLAISKRYQLSNVLKKRKFKDNAKWNRISLSTTQHFFKSIKLQ